MSKSIDFYGMMASATVINISDVNIIMQSIIVILSIIYGIIKIIKEPKKRE